MVIIPLGLRAKLYIKPWATVVIALLTIGLTIKAHLDQATLTEFRKQTFEKHDVYGRSHHAMRISCKANFQDTVCDFFDRYVKAGDLAEPERIVQLIENFDAFDPSTKEKAKNYIQRLPAILNEQSEQFSNLKTFQEYSAATTRAHQEIEQYYIDHELLSHENINWKSLTLAQFAHNVWWHLLVNLLILGLFALFLEQRVGVPFFVLTYLVGGYIGMGLQAHFLDPYQTAASSTPNVMAIVGAYLFFFFKEKIKMYLNVFFAFEKKFLTPVWLYTGIVVFLGNIFYVGDDFSSKVVLLSHLAGLGAGIFCALIASLIIWVQKDFLFSKEQLYYFTAKKTQQPLKKVSSILNLLEINPYNFVAVEYMFRSIMKYNIEASTIPKEALSKVCRLMIRMINHEFRVNPTQAYSILSGIPLTWNFTELPMPRLGKSILQTIEGHILEHDWSLAIRLYDLYLFQNKDAKTTESIRLTVQKVMVHVESPINPQSHQNVEWLRRYAMFNRQTILGQMIGEKYEDKTSFSAA